MRHSHVKLKKMLQDRCAELEHARSRAEQYEAEVKKLRCRIEELKSDLSSVEDEVHGSVQVTSFVFRFLPHLQKFSKSVRLLQTNLAMVVENF